MQPAIRDTSHQRPKTISSDWSHDTDHLGRADTLVPSVPEAYTRSPHPDRILLEDTASEGLRKPLHCILEGTAVSVHRQPGMVEQIVSFMSRRRSDASGNSGSPHPDDRSCWNRYPDRHRMSDDHSL